MTEKESNRASDSESGSEADTESQADQTARQVKTQVARVKVQAVRVQAQMGEGVLEDGGSPQGDSSGKIVEVSCHEAEESGSESGSSSSESEVEVNKAKPSKKTAEADPNTTLPELDSKDSEEECKMNHCGFA